MLTWNFLDDKLRKIYYIIWTKMCKKWLVLYQSTLSFCFLTRLIEIWYWNFQKITIKNCRDPNVRPVSSYVTSWMSRGKNCIVKITDTRASFWFQSFYLSRRNKDDWTPFFNIWWLSNVRTNILRINAFTRLKMLSHSLTLLLLWIRILRRLKLHCITKPAVMPTG